MKKQLAGFEVMHLVRELQVLVGAKVDKVFNPDKKSILIQFYTRQGKQILHVLAPEMMYLREFKEESGEPTGLAMHLRKLLVNSRVKSVSQVEFERVVKLVFEVLADGLKVYYSLFIELFGSGNIILVKDEKIIAATEYRVYSGRVLRPGEKYVCPSRPHNFLVLSAEKLGEILQSSSKESVVKTLALDVGLGGVYAEELCFLAGIDKKMKFIGSEQVEILFGAIQELLQRRAAGFLVMQQDKLVDVVPIQLKFYEKYEQKMFSSYNEVLVAAASLEMTSTPKESPYGSKIIKARHIIAEQKKTVDSYGLKSAEEQKKAELIYFNYQMIEKLLSGLSEAKKKHSWEEIKAKLKAHQLVKELNEKDGKLIVELE